MDNGSMRADDRWTYTLLARKPPVLPIGANGGGGGGGRTLPCWATLLSVCAASCVALLLCLGSVAGAGYYAYTTIDFKQLLADWGIAKIFEDAMANALASAQESTTNSVTTPTPSTT